MSNSKKELSHVMEELAKTQKELETVRKELHQLEDAHVRDFVVEMPSFMGRNYHFVSGFRHEKVQASTRAAGLVSLQELASLIVDGEPIKRQRTQEETIKAACCTSRTSEDKSNEKGGSDESL